MKNRLSVLFFLLIGIGLYSTKLNAQGSLPDDGITSEAHRANIGKAVFSQTEIEFQKEDASTFVNAFTWGDPIYGRFYWNEGLNNVYLKQGIDTSAGYNLMVEIIANGQPFFSYITEKKGVKTTYPICLLPANGDSYSWDERFILYNNLELLNAGDNKLTINVYPYISATEKVGTILCTGSFSLNVDEASITRKKLSIFTEISTRYQGDNSWTEWNIYLEGKSGSMRTRWSEDKSEWTYEIGDYSGNIKTTWQNSFEEWTLSSSEGTINIKQRWSNDWKEWNITSGTEVMTVRTKYQGDDAWKEWDVAGSGGSMSIRTKYQGDDAWKEWSIYDGMISANVHMKMAAVFICVYVGALK